MKHTFTLINESVRRRACEMLNKAPDGWQVIIKPKTRTLEQNAKLWAMLHDIARQVEWYGQYLTADEWKCVFTASLKQQKVVPGIDGGGFVAIGAHTSKMCKHELSDLIELMSAFGAERGVMWSDDGTF